MSGRFRIDTLHEDGTQRETKDEGEGEEQSREGGYKADGSRRFEARSHARDARWVRSESTRPMN